MERISIPFAAGAATSAILSATIGSPDCTGIVSSALMLIFLATSIILQKIPQRSVGYAAIFFTAGFFCHATAEMTKGIASGMCTPLVSAATEACTRLRSAIDRMEIGDHARNELLKALLTGDRSGLTEEIQTSFRDAGASHILALSGLHMGIIYTLLARLLTFLGNSPRATKIRSTLLVLAAAFYMMMTGAGPSIVRAFLFILLSEICRNLPGRVRDPARILQSALIIQLAATPTVITSLGFQLSYLAVAGIVWVMPKLSSWYPGDGSFDPLKKIWDLCALSISCQCLTAPLVWIRFRTFPQFFLVTNLVAMPLATISIAGALFCLATGTHCPEIAFKVCGQCVSMLIYSLDVLASLSA